MGTKSAWHSSRSRVSNSDELTNPQTSVFGLFMSVVGGPKMSNLPPTVFNEACSARNARMYPLELIVPANAIVNGRSL